MGNSASGSKDKRKGRKRDARRKPRPEEAEEEDEWTYEYEYVEVEDEPAPALANGRGFSKQSVRPGLPRSGSRAPPTFDQMRKPLRSAALFVRNYASTLHRVCVALV